MGELVVTMGLGLVLDMIFIEVTSKLWLGLVHDVAVDQMADASWLTANAWALIDVLGGVLFMGAIGVVLALLFVNCTSGLWKGR